MPTEPPRIRAAVDDDWPSLWAIIREVLASGDSYNLGPETTEAAARLYWMGPGIDAFVAESNGKIVGTYALKADQPGRGSHVANAGFMVRSDHAGRGIGAALGEHALNTARARGYRAMQFNSVVSTNTRAVELWKRLGFSVIGVVPQGFQHPEQGFVDVFIMHRVL